MVPNWVLLEKSGGYVKEKGEVQKEKNLTLPRVMVNKFISTRKEHARYGDA